ncbi:MAG: alanine racemase [Acidimicrobiales bacterium]|nr:alanine racemase [Acidimicrobiales bacterium]
MRPTWADIDLAAVAHNVEQLRELVSPATVCAVVKADGYGHGAVPVARAAVEAGASWLAVALVEEGRQLRQAGLTVPILVLSEPRPSEMAEVVDSDLRPTVYSGEGLASIAAAARAGGRVVPVHVKVDTGMRRVGAAPDDALTLVKAVDERPSLALEGLWTHCAIADEPAHPFTEQQLDRFDAVIAEVRAAGFDPPSVHAGNSAVAIAHPRGRYDMVRCGIAVYGLPPAPGLEGRVDLRPAMSVCSEVSMVKRVPAGEGVSYGLRWSTPTERVIATVPVGYADGIRRSLSAHGGEVLIRGQRRPMAGVITMDQLMVDCGDDDDVQAGDEVVLIGRQGDAEITATEVATRLDTISYEVVCDIESRIPRRYR